MPPCAWINFCTRARRPRSPRLRRRDGEVGLLVALGDRPRRPVGQRARELDGDVSRRRASARSPGRCRSSCRTLRCETYTIADSFALLPIPTASSARASWRRRTLARSPCARLAPFRDSRPRPSVSSTIASVSPCGRLTMQSGVSTRCTCSRCGTNPSTSIEQTSSPGWPRLVQDVRPIVEHRPSPRKARRIEAREFLALQGPDPARARELIDKSSTGSPREARAPRGGGRPGRS